MYKSLHPRANADRLYLKRKNGGKMLKHSYCNNAQKTILRKKLIRGTEEVRDDINSWLWIKKDI